MKNYRITVLIIGIAIFLIFTMPVYSQDSKREQIINESIKNNEKVLELNKTILQKLEDFQKKFNFRIRNKTHNKTIHLIAKDKDGKETAYILMPGDGLFIEGLSPDFEIIEIEEFKGKTLKYEGEIYRK